MTNQLDLNLMKNKKNVVFTDRSNNCMNILLKEIRKYRVLDDKEENDLLERVVIGDKRARDLLINSNLRWVFSKAKQYTWSGMTQLDLFQTGSMGLTAAVDKYDPKKGECFRAYALSCVEGELLNAVRAHTRWHKLSLEDPAFAGDDCKLTLEDVLPSGHQDYADWDARYESDFNAMKAKVKMAFFADAADLWADYILMTEKGYTLSDVAKKYHVTEEMAKKKIKEINQWLSERYDF